MDIIKAQERYYEELAQHDRHIHPEELRRKIQSGQMYVALENGKLAGWLRYGLF